MAYHIEQPELFRTKIRGKFSEILGNEKNATNLEKGIYNYAIQEANFRKRIRNLEIKIRLNRKTRIKLN